MSREFRIAESDLFAASIAEPRFRKIQKKIVEYIYPQLRQNPLFGPNIKSLKGELSGFFRYRTGDYRIFYTVDSEEKIVIIHEIEDRKDAYRKR